MEDLRPLQNGREGYKGQIRLSRFGSVVRVLAHRLKGLRLDAREGHILGSAAWVRVHAGGNQSMCLSDIMPARGGMLMLS